MVILCLFFSVVMYFTGLISFCMKRNHLLLMLLSLEFVMLSLYMSLYLYLMFFNYEFYFSMVFISMSVCEGALGLAILVSMVRTHSNDYFQSFNVLW
uniref:NADH-ubiquinone oxidoreductase chain 4L n=1 Tax=Oryctes rhinoceros TaxID=72550 RepID=A0A7D4XNQ6_ORYRH|nr:NADH dehydrogenase subunit 4L [Oryctes rhinoceros]QKX48647.1 NADH dehydrogenase subunit 4L [Oryctes rhinoceros]QSZ78111.1 NADH dehydrogenase subunit 4L [Oryctes rhinoceros]WAT94181.1 NADH dehydrogenase subunit 4L [Oryctes rhinoceros]WAT94194.1 NADH dehydrogenase subunit 4L [Oryctes rhinoceros]WAT94207.1 NADH dehydrogenase subunit 4L [Oryctes rhinoceros]